MLPKQIALNPSVKRLLDESYEIDIRHGYLLVRVPYVTSLRAVQWGTLVTDLAIHGEYLGPPKDHQVWFAGEFPCNSDGGAIGAIAHSSGSMPLWDGFVADHRFSNKPEGKSGFETYAEKMLHYIAIITNHATFVDPNVIVRTGKVAQLLDEASVFRYFDSASTRADIVAVSQKLETDRIAFVGLGGTGAYALDLVAKTPVREIHLFDGDIFLPHNAFRSPGAATQIELDKQPLKVNYYAEKYGAMHSRIIPHPVFLDDENLDLLDDFDFVFLSVDNGNIRALVSEYLLAHKTPFVDVGMDILLEPGTTELYGTCRTTLCTPEQFDHFLERAPLSEAKENDLYRRNIQVADLNALNAALAVILWKQRRGFYMNHPKAHHLTYSMSTQSLTRDVMVGLGVD